LIVACSAFAEIYRKGDVQGFGMYTSKTIAPEQFKNVVKLLQELFSELFSRR